MAIYPPWPFTFMIVACSNLQRAMLSFLVVVLCSYLPAQVTITEKRLDVELISTDDGLPQGLVLDIIQDRAGFMWYTTKDGLARSDGYDFTVFKHDALDSTSIAGDHTTFLYEDSKGYIWVAIKGVGLDRYDPRSMIFEHVSTSKIGNNSAVTEISDITEDMDGRIWMITDKHKPFAVFAVFAEEGTDMLHFHLPKWIHPELKTFNTVDDIQFSQNGAIWLSNFDSLLCFLPSKPAHQQSWRLEHPVSSIWQYAESASLYINSDSSKLWVCSSNSILGFDLNSNLPMDTIHLPEKGQLFLASWLDDEDRLWYQTLNDDHVRLDLTTRALAVLDIHVKDRPNMHLERSYFRMKDARGNILAGTAGFGALKMNRSSMLFSTYPPRNGHGYYVHEYMVSGYRQFALNKESFRPIAGHSMIDSIRNRFAEYGLDGRWDGASTDDEGKTWAALIGDYKTLPQLVFVTASGELKYQDISPSGYYPNRVLHGSGEEIWICASTDPKEWDIRSHLLRFNTRTRSITAAYEFPDLMLMREYWPIAQWSVGPDGVIWMATVDGLLSFDTQEEHWEKFVHIPNDNTSLPWNMVFSLCPDPVDPSRFLWVGTEGKGLAKLDKRSGKFQRYTTKDGLPNDVIYGILSDPAGALWLSTNKGLCRFEPTTGNIRTFTHTDGVAGDEFNRYGSCILDDGRFAFTGMNGTTVFDPEELIQEDEASKTVITGTRLANGKIDDQVQGFAPYYSLEANASDPYRGVIELEPNESLITFTFACMDHTVPSKNTFRYKLEGYSDEWVENDHRNEATFTNLDPGVYKFTVQGRNSAGVLDTLGASIVLIVQPPWWGTWWFRALTALSLIAIIYFIYRYRLRQRLQVLELRTRIARDLHDEIGSTLSSVSMYAAVAEGNGTSAGSSEQVILQKISEGSTSALEAMNDIVWAVNSDNDSMKHVAQRMQAFANNLGESYGFQVDFNMADDIIDLAVQMDVRKEIYLIFKEALNNAAKYSQGDLISVSMQRVESAVCMLIADNGIGFDPDNISEELLGGNGLSNMNARAEQIGGILSVDSAVDSGTEVRLLFNADGKSLDSRIFLSHE